TAGNAAFGLLLGLHVSSLVYWFQPLLVEAPFRTRILLTVGLFGMLGLGLYMPMLNYADAHWFSPLQIKGHTVVVQKLVAASKVRRGEWIAYTVAEGGDHNVFVYSGMGFGPVLAVPGDRIAFGKKSYSVNGIAFPTQPYMPQSGEMVVRERHWFMWPDF